METNILPLALTMMAGPQILSALLFITNSKPVAVSLAYIVGIVTAVTAGVGVATVLGHSVLKGLNLGAHSNNSSIKAAQLGIVGLLIVLAIRAFLTRKTSRPPRWLQRPATLSPVAALLLGWLVIWLMPSDVLIMLTVGLDLVRKSQGVVQALPFVALVGAIAALPLLAYVLFRKKFQAAMPGIRDWINQYSWLINIAVYLLFVGIILSGG